MRNFGSVHAASNNPHLELRGVAKASHSLRSSRRSLNSKDIGPDRREIVRNGRSTCATGADHATEDTDGSEREASMFDAWNQQNRQCDHAHKQRPPERCVRECCEPDGHRRAGPTLDGANDNERRALASRQ